MYLEQAFPLNNEIKNFRCISKKCHGGLRACQIPQYIYSRVDELSDKYNLKKDGMKVDSELIYDIVLLSLPY